MFETTIDNLAILLPLLMVQAGLMIFCIIKIHTEGVNNMSKIAWTLIVIFINLCGPILYLLVGRKKDSYDSGE